MGRQVSLGRMVQAALVRLSRNSIVTWGWTTVIGSAGGEPPQALLAAPEGPRGWDGEPLGVPSAQLRGGAPGAGDAEAEAAGDGELKASGFGAVRIPVK